MKILVLEDEDTIRRMISALVQARGYQVVAVSNGVKALDEFEREQPDAVLLDLMVPGVFDGFEVCRRIRASATGSQVPLIVISAMEGAQERALQAGATKFFAKPFSPTALLKELELIKNASTPASSRFRI